VTIHSFL